MAGSVAVEVKTIIIVLFDFYRLDHGLKPAKGETDIKVIFVLILALVRCKDDGAFLTRTNDLLRGLSKKFVDCFVLGTR